MSKKDSGDDTYKKMTLALVAFGALFLEGRVLYDLWRWFVVPLDVDPLTYWQAMGIGVMVNMLVRTNGIQRDTTKASAEQLIVAIVAWCVGWAFSSAMRP